MASHGLTSFIKSITRPVSGTNIDHIYGRFDSSTLSPSAGLNFDLGISDHCMIGLKISCLNNVRNFNNNSPPVIQKINFSALYNSLRFEKWESVYAEKDVSKAYNLFLSTLQAHITESSFVTFPKNSKTILKPWVNCDLLKKIKLKNKLRVKCRKHPTNTRLRKRVKLLTYNINKECRFRHDHFYKNRFLAAKGDVKKEWNVVNDILNRNKKAETNPFVLDIDGELVSHPLDVANHLNDFSLQLEKSPLQRIIICAVLATTT